MTELHASGATPAALHQSVFYLSDKRTVTDQLPVSEARENRVRLSHGGSQLFQPE